MKPLAEGLVIGIEGNGIKLRGWSAHDYILE
jgi:hypothetical protein